MEEKGQKDRALRELILGRLYETYLEEGLYRGVVSKKSLLEEFKAKGVLLERNLEYILERGLIRMHKIEDLISITTEGIDWVEGGGSSLPPEVSSLIGRIERLLQAILERLESNDKKE
ncbi:MAG: hypothetical protein U9N45_02780 [Gemmatimonadota bacterium]|nr:hypothetical protein [Gemmatimonadota bacterium]